MTVLILGLLIFLGTHSLRIVADDWRNRHIARLGAMRWKGIYALVSLVGEMSDGAVDDGGLGWATVRRERRKQAGERQELAVQRLTTLTLNRIVLVSLLSSVDTLARLGLGLGRRGA